MQQTVHMRFRNRKFDSCRMIVAERADENCIFPEACALGFPPGEFSINSNHLSPRVTRG